MATALAERGWRAITMDMRGHGDSQWAPGGDYRLRSFAADVDSVLPRLGDRPFLIGASLGGFTSMLLAGEMHPGVTRGIVLVDIIPEMESAGSARIADFTAFFNLKAVGQPGHLEYFADTTTMFNNPQNEEAERYVSGRFG